MGAKAIKDAVISVTDLVVTDYRSEPPTCTNCPQPASTCRCVARHFRDNKAAK